MEVPSFEGFRFYGVGKLKTIPDGFRVLLSIVRGWWNYLWPSKEKEHIGFHGNLPDHFPPFLTSSLQEKDSSYEKAV
jgi:hypothetical protein